TRRSSGPARGKRPGAPKRARPRRERHVAAIPARPDMLEVRASTLHGKGVFARRRIRKGTRIIEYLGDRVSHREADRRYETKTTDDGHTFLFIVDRGIVIDGGHNGNDARFINHGCDPNCESAIEDRRVFIEALRTIQPGEELMYDYQIGRDKSDPPNVDEIFACHCGAASCRGSMLWPPRRKPRVSRERRA
ncbi:MAG TPA: SET domain-containing protein-lysine N-methyltransferase, partial [Steroidobacteraceae bacterium]